MRSGEYANVDEVIQEAFRLLQQRDKRRRDAREELSALFSEMAARGEFDAADQEPENASEAPEPLPPAQSQE